MKKQDIIDKFIFGKDKESPTTYLRARFFIVFQFIFFTLNLVSLPYYFTLEYINLLPEIKITYVLLVLLFASVFFIYPKYGYRITFVNVHSFFASFVSMYTTYYFSGGIFSPDHIFAPAISIYAFLVANRITGIVWTVIGLFQIVFFYYAAINHFQPFQEKVIHLEATYYLYSIIFSVAFAVILVLLYENMMNNLLALINRSKLIIEEKNKMILDSINYSSRIQKSILPEHVEIEKMFQDNFIFYKPKDVVSGDFYFFHSYNENCSILAVADCTGHGVPGALMSFMCSEKLTMAVNQYRNPTEILSHVNREIKKTLKQTDEHSSTKDGMDIALCLIDKSKHELVYSGANRPLWIKKKNETEIQTIKPTKMALGGFTANDTIFESHTIPLNYGDCLYLFTDGYSDTFGKNGKKMTTKKFRNMLNSIHDLKMTEQGKKLEDFLMNWMDDTEQIDDILVIGIKY